VAQFTLLFTRQWFLSIDPYQINSHKTLLLGMNIVRCAAAHSKHGDQFKSGHACHGRSEPNVSFEQNPALLRHKQLLASQRNPLSCS